MAVFANENEFIASLIVAVFIIAGLGMTVDANADVFSFI